MHVHRNAKTTPKGRALIVQRVDREGWSVAQTAAAFGVSVRTVYKWRRRYRDGGGPALLDRSSVPHHMPRLTGPAHVAAVRALRQQRLAGAAIAQRLGLPRATVGVVLRGRKVTRSRPVKEFFSAGDWRRIKRDPFRQPRRSG